LSTGLQPGRFDPSLPLGFRGSHGGAHFAGGHLVDITVQFLVEPLVRKKLLT
jgi:hypothetical protein